MPFVLEPDLDKVRGIHDVIVKEKGRKRQNLPARSVLTVFDRSCFFYSLLLGLGMESRQLRPSIAPQQNLEWKKEAHSHRLQRSLTESNAM